MKHGSLKIKKSDEIIGITPFLRHVKPEYNAIVAALRVIIQFNVAFQKFINMILCLFLQLCGSCLPFLALLVGFGSGLLAIFKVFADSCGIVAFNKTG